MQPEPLSSLHDETPSAIELRLARDGSRHAIPPPRYRRGGRSRRFPAGDGVFCNQRTHDRSEYEGFNRIGRVANLAKRRVAKLVEGIERLANFAQSRRQLRKQPIGPCACRSSATPSPGSKRSTRRMPPFSPNGARSWSLPTSLALKPQSRKRSTLAQTG